MEVDENEYGELLRDAGRYRWLRKNASSVNAGKDCQVSWTWEVDGYGVDDFSLDAAIDAVTGTASTVASNKSTEVLNSVRDDFSQVEFDQTRKGD